MAHTLHSDHKVFNLVSETWHVIIK